MVTESTKPAESPKKPVSKPEVKPGISDPKKLGKGK